MRLRLAVIVVAVMAFFVQFADAQQRQESDKEQLYRYLSELQSCIASLNAARQSAGDLGVQLQRGQERIQQLEAEKAAKEKAKGDEAKPTEEPAK